MTFKEQRLAFAEILKGDYPLEEINSFFQLMTEHHFGYNRFETHQRDNNILPKEQESTFTEAIKRLSEKEPIQYIIGETEFYGLPFKVTKDTLIPRPETEELVDLLINANIDRFLEIDILDIGTGSGCIAISLAKNISLAKVSAIDVSAEALKIATQNAKLNNVTVTFREKDILKALDLDKKYDIIVSNPPYVRELEKKLMQSNVLDYEPESALFVSDDDPLIFYRKIAELALVSLKTKGKLFFEINEYLASEMKTLLSNLGFSKIEIYQDIYGKDRIVQCEIN